MPFLELGATPYDEDCAQIGSADYKARSKIECEVYCRQLSRLFPKGHFIVKNFSHDFGMYREVVAVMDSEEEREAAFDADNDGPANWDDTAKEELRTLLSASKIPF